MENMTEIMIIEVFDDVLLKQIELSDAKPIFNTINSQRAYLGKWLPFVSLTQKVEDTEGFIKAMLNAPIDKSEFVFVIHYQNEFAGLIGFKDTDRVNGKTEIGYWLSEPFQHKGIVTQSVKELCKFAFDELGINRIQIKCATGNNPSKKIPQKLGFKLEGVERDGEMLISGNYTDLEVYSKLKREF